MGGVDGGRLLAVSLDERARARDVCVTFVATQTYCVDPLVRVVDSSTIPRPRIASSADDFRSQVALLSFDDPLVVEVGKDHRAGTKEKAAVEVAILNGRAFIEPPEQQVFNRRV